MGPRYSVLQNPLLCHVDLAGRGDQSRAHFMVYEGATLGSKPHFPQKRLMQQKSSRAVPGSMPLRFPADLKQPLRTSPRHPARRKRSLLHSLRLEMPTAEGNICRSTKQLSCHSYHICHPSLLSCHSSCVTYSLLFICPHNNFSGLSGRVPGWSEARHPPLRSYLFVIRLNQQGSNRKRVSHSADV